MAAAVDKIRDSWERKNPREQQLIAFLGIVVLCAFILFMVNRIRSGMADIEKQNHSARKALQALAVIRNANAKAKARGEGKAKMEIPEVAIVLDSYLNGILKEMEIVSPAFPELREKSLSAYTELSFEIELKELNLAEVAELLERIETGSPMVVVKELHIDRNFKDKEKLDLEMMVATYKKKGPEKGNDDDEEEDG